MLVVPKSNAAMGIGLFVIFVLLRARFPPEWGGQFGLFALVVLIGLPLSWAVTKVRFADAS